MLNQDLTVKTIRRWISLKICCGKELKKIEALISMFCSRGGKNLGIVKGKDDDDDTEIQKIAK